MKTDDTTTGGQDEAPPPLHFSPVRIQRAADEIAQQIRREIGAGRLKPGSKLPAERALAQELGVSRNTLREAVRSLEQAGLVELKKGAHGGIFVTRHNGDSIVTGMLDLYRLGGITPRQLTLARLWIEPIIVREACRRATPADIALLEDNIAQAWEAAQANEFEKKFTLHHEFHRILARIAGNPIMLVIIDGLIAVLVEFIEKIGRGDNSHYVFPSRRRFMEHFRRGDAEAAVTEMTQLLEQFQENYFPVEMEPAGDARHHA